jgi:hypothetical protein
VAAVALLSRVRESSADRPPLLQRGRVGVRVGVTAVALLSKG